MTTNRMLLPEEVWVSPQTNVKLNRTSEGTWKCLVSAEYCKMKFALPAMLIANSSFPTKEVCVGFLNSSLRDTQAPIDLNMFFRENQQTQEITFDAIVGLGSEEPNGDMISQ